MGEVLGLIFVCLGWFFFERLRVFYLLLWVGFLEFLKLGDNKFDGEIARQKMVVLVVVFWVMPSEIWWQIRGKKWWVFEVLLCEIW